MRTFRMRRLARKLSLAGFSMAVCMLTSTAFAANPHEDKGKIIPNRIDGLYYKGGHFWYDDGSSHVYHGGKLGKAVSQTKAHSHSLLGALSPFHFGHGYGHGYGLGHGGHGLGLNHHGIGLDGNATHSLDFGPGGAVVDHGYAGHGGVIHTGVVTQPGYSKHCPVPVGTPIGCGFPGPGQIHSGMSGHPGVVMGHPGMGHSGHGLGMGHGGHGLGMGHGGHGLGMGHGGHGLGLVHRLKAGLLGHSTKDAVFVGPGGPVPLAPGASNGYINPLKSPRDFLAYPPFATNVP